MLGGVHRLVRLEEGRVPERDFHVVIAAADQRFERDRVDVVQVDPLEYLVVERQRLVPRELEQDLAEALILVAAAEPIVRLTKTLAKAEFGAARP